MDYGISPNNAFNVESTAPVMSSMMRAVSGAIRQASCNGGKINVSSIRQVSAPPRIQTTREEIEPNNSPMKRRASRIQRVTGTDTSLV